MFKEVIGSFEELWPLQDVTKLSLADNDSSFESMHDAMKENNILFGCHTERSKSEAFEW